MRTALLIDGSFYINRYYRLKGSQKPAYAAKDLHRMCLRHLLEYTRNEDQEEQERQRNHLYRIFFYDCQPLTKKVHNPVNDRAIDFSTTPIAKWRLQFHVELKKLRKVALRLGYLNERSGHWTLRPDVLKQLLTREVTVDGLSENDVKYDVRQKGVDMRIGLDIASMAFKRQVDQIVLVAGDSDFVPAAKLARREGIDFILDPMWAPIKRDLLEHIDGLRSVFPRPEQDATTSATPGVQDGPGDKSSI